MFFIKTALSPSVSITWCFPAWHWSQNLKEIRILLHIEKSAAHRSWGQNFKGITTNDITLGFFFRHDKFTEKHCFNPGHDRYQFNIWRKVIDLCTIICYYCYCEYIFKIRKIWVFLSEVWEEFLGSKMEETIGNSEAPR